MAIQKTRITKAITVCLCFLLSITAVVSTFFMNGDMAVAQVTVNEDTDTHYLKKTITEEANFPGIYKAEIEFNNKNTYGDAYVTLVVDSSASAAISDTKTMYQNLLTQFKTRNIKLSLVIFGNSTLNTSGSFSYGGRSYYYSNYLYHEKENNVLSNNRYSFLRYGWHNTVVLGDGITYDSTTSNSLPKSYPSHFVFYSHGGSDHGYFNLSDPTEYQIAYHLIDKLDKHPVARSPYDAAWDTAYFRHLKPLYDAAPNSKMLMITIGDFMSTWTTANDNQQKEVAFHVAKVIQGKEKLPGAATDGTVTIGSTKVFEPLNDITMINILTNNTSRIESIHSSLYPNVWELVKKTTCPLPATGYNGYSTSVYECTNYAFSDWVRVEDDANFPNFYYAKTDNNFRQIATQINNMLTNNTRFRYFPTDKEVVIHESINPLFEIIQNNSQWPISFGVARNNSLTNYYTKAYETYPLSSMSASSDFSNAMYSSVQGYRLTTYRNTTESATYATYSYGIVSKRNISEDYSVDEITLELPTNNTVVGTPQNASSKTYFYPTGYTSGSTTLYPKYKLTYYFKLKDDVVITETTTLNTHLENIDITGGYGSTTFTSELLSNTDVNQYIQTGKLEGHHAAYLPGIQTTLTPKNYNVVFDSNNVVASSRETKTQSITYGTTEKLDENTFSEYYSLWLDGNGGAVEGVTSLMKGSEATFLGWAETRTGNAVYADEAAVTNLADPGGSKTLYAKWVAQIELPEPSRSGYYFVGWCEDEEGEGTKYPAGTEYQLTGNGVTLYAIWGNIPTYTVTYDYWSYGGTSVDMGTTSNTFYEDSGAMFDPSPVASKEGYEFLGWTPVSPDKYVAKNGTPNEFSFEYWGTSKEECDEYYTQNAQSKDIDVEEQFELLNTKEYREAVENHGYDWILDETWCVPMKLDSNFELPDENFTVYAVFVKKVTAEFSVIDTEYYNTTGIIRESILTEYGYVYNNEESVTVMTPSYNAAYYDGCFSIDLINAGAYHEYGPLDMFIKHGENFNPLEDEITSTVTFNINDNTPVFYGVYQANSVLLYNINNDAENESYFGDSFYLDGYYLTAPTMPSPYSYYWVEPVDELYSCINSGYFISEEPLIENQTFTGWTIPDMTEAQHRYFGGDTVPFAGLPNTNITFSPEQIKKDNTAYAQWLTSSITADKETVGPGKEITYTVTASTTGDGSQMVLLADIPTNTTFVESADGVEYTKDNKNYVKFTIDDVNEGDKFSFTYTVRVSDTVSVGTNITAGLETYLYIYYIDGEEQYFRHEPADVETTVELVEFTVTYDYTTNGGTNLIDGEETVSSPAVYQKTCEDESNFYGGPLEVPVGIKNNGWEFYGWSLSPNSVTKIENTYKITQDITVYAIYRKAAYADFSGYYTYDPETGTDTPVTGMSYAWNNENITWVPVPGNFICDNVPSSETLTYEEGKLVVGGLFNGYFIDEDINGENAEDVSPSYVGFSFYDGTPAFNYGAMVDVNTNKRPHMHALYDVFPTIWFDSNGGQEEYTYDDTLYIEAQRTFGTINKTYFETADVQPFVVSQTSSKLDTVPTKDNNTFTGWNIEGYNTPAQRYAHGATISVTQDSVLVECDHLAKAQWLTSEITSQVNGQFVAGNIITYTVSATTTGAADLLVLTADIPENTELVSTNVVVTSDGNHVLFTVDDVGANATITRTYQVRIKDNVVEGDEITANLTASLYCDVYSDGNLVTDEPFVHQSSITDEALTGYKVTYYIGSEVAGTCVAPVDSTIYSEGQTATILPEGNKLMKTGYIFLGWRDNNTNENYKPGDTITVEHNVDLYPLWAKVTITTPERWMAPNEEGYAEYVVTIDISQNAKNVTMQLDCPVTVDLLDIEIPYIQQGNVMRDRDVTAVESQQRGEYGATHDGYTLLIENANSTHYEMTFDNDVCEDLAPGTDIKGSATIYNNYASQTDEVINTIGYEVFYIFGDNYSIMPYEINTSGVLDFKASGSDVTQEKGVGRIPKYYALDAEGKTMTPTGTAAAGFIGWVPLALSYNEGEGTIIRNKTFSSMYNAGADFSITGNKVFYATYAQISQEIQDKAVNYIPGEKYHTNITVNCPGANTYSDYLDIIIEPKSGTSILEILSVKAEAGANVSDITDDVVITESDGIYTVRITPTEDATYTIEVEAEINSSARPNAFTGCLVSMNVETGGFLNNDIPFKTFDANEDNVSVASYYRVTYKANGGTGTIPVDMTYYRSGEHAIVASSEEISKEGYVFSGWCTQSDGTSGTTYIPGNEIRVTSNVTLYAIWGTQATLPETGGQTVAIITAIGTFTLLSIGLYLALKKKSK